eukprot:tig00000880_g5193.t1
MPRQTARPSAAQRPLFAGISFELPRVRLEAPLRLQRAQVAAAARPARSKQSKAVAVAPRNAPRKQDAIRRQPFIRQCIAHSAPFVARLVGGLGFGRRSRIVAERDVASSATGEQQEGLLAAPIGPIIKATDDVILSLTQANVVIEVPRWSFVKRKQDGSIDIISPLPTPYNYGSIPDIQQEDGDPLDVLILGKRLPFGHRGTYPVYGVVRFVDAGDKDDKIICGQSEKPPSVMDRMFLGFFFSNYARFKSVLNAVRGKKGETRYDGLLLRDLEGEREEAAAQAAAAAEVPPPRCPAPPRRLLADAAAPGASAPKPSPSPPRPRPEARRPGWLCCRPAPSGPAAAAPRPAAPAAATPRPAALRRRPPPGGPCCAGPSQGGRPRPAPAPSPAPAAPAAPKPAPPPAAAPPKKTQ